MSPFITILLAILPELLQILDDLIKKKQQLSERDRQRLATIAHACRQINDAATQLGCSGLAPRPHGSQNSAGGMSEMTVDDIINDLNAIATTMRYASTLPFPGAQYLGEAALALTSLASNRQLVEAVFNGITTAAGVLETILAWLRNNGHASAASWFTAFPPHPAS